MCAARDGFLQKGSKQARSILPGSSVPPFCEPVRLGQTSSEERMGGSPTWAGRPARVGRLAMDGWGSCCANERERYRWHDISVAHQRTAPAFGRLREKSSNALRQPTSPAHPRAQHTKAPLKLKEAPEAPSAASSAPHSTRLDAFLSTSGRTTDCHAAAGPTAGFLFLWKSANTVGTVWWSRWWSLQCPVRITALPGRCGRP
ncbi:hypothetical protein B0T13DRAFT_443687 [Neurospora crassa]|nr:hypothetical protein B0T13DRAFT_443687 [Neurospora crassa]